MQKTYRVVETNSKGEPIPVYVDDLAGTRKALANGETFTAELDTEKYWDKRGEKPLLVDTKQEFVVSANIDVKPGCLTSLIRTGRAKLIEQPKPQPAAPVAAKK